MALDIVQKDNPVLHEKAQPIPTKDIQSEKIQSIIRDMSVALEAQHDGVAIAAPQIGVPLRIFVVSGIVFTPEDEEKKTDMVFINPEIKKLSKQKERMDEGCLSVRWKYGSVLRHKKATIVAYDEHGKSFTYNASGLLAQIFQHETDHLDGVLFIDKADDVRDLEPEEIEKIKRGDDA